VHTKITACSIVFAALLAGMSTLPTAYAQSYPAKPVRLIVPSGPGPGDTETRGIAQFLSESLGQPFVVDNRVGGEGIVGVEACAKAPRDGYTLCMITVTQITFLEGMRLNLPYDSQRDLAAVAHFGFLDAALLVHPSVPANSVRELFDLAAAKPDTITWGSWGISSPGYLYMEWLRKAKGISFFNVPYKGSSQAAQAALAGEVQVAYYGAGQAAGFVRSNRLKALAVSSDKRLPFLPGVPTLKEVGVDIRVPRTWYGMAAPVGTPKDIVQRLNAEVAKITANPQFIEKFMTTQGITPPGPFSPEEFAAFLRRDRENFQELMKTIGLKPEA
jgi:tripartite-type tricarboxylate transporter receptor subunit TctC